MNRNNTCAFILEITNLYISLSLKGGKDLPEYKQTILKQTRQSFKQAFDKLHRSIEEAHEANKARYDKNES